MNKTAPSHKANEPIESASETNILFPGFSPQIPFEPIDLNAKPVVEIKLKPRKPKSLLEFVSSKNDWYDSSPIKNNENNVEDVPF